MRPPSDAERLPCNEGRQLGRVQRKIQKKRKSFQNGLSKEYGEAYEKVARDDIGRLGSVQEILRKSTNFLRRVIAPVGGLGGATLSHICPQCHSSSWRTTLGGYRRRTVTAGRWSSAVGGVRYGEHPTVYWWCSSVLTPMTQKVFRAHAAPQGLCDFFDQRAQAVGEPADGR